MENVKQQVIDRLKQANNILVTVKNNPNIDLLSACIGLSLVLDKLDKHAAAVFSGEVPSAMEFLKPEDTIEQTPNSLRDFIIALDKSKADKLRYKVEDKVVRIFITPYKTSLSQDDLEFSQGDFNIDVVVALGVHEQAELDAAITAHGRILHDASVISINNTPNGNLGSLNWQEISASSVSEMVTDLTMQLGDNLLDGQVSTALLTGIVAETERFSNDKTTPQTMRIAGELMAGGANQQLVANELRKRADEVPHKVDAPAEPATEDDHGMLQIDHPEEPQMAAAPEEKPQPEVAGQKPEDEEQPVTNVHREILPMPEPSAAGNIGAATPGDGLLAGVMDDEETAKNDHGYLIDQATARELTPPNPFAAPAPAPAEPPLLTHSQTIMPPVEETPVAPAATSAAPAPEPIAPLPPTEPSLPSQQPELPKPEPAPESIVTESAEPTSQTLEEIEESVGSSHVAGSQPAPAPGDNLDDARMQVLEALRQGPQPLETPAAFNAHPLGAPLHDEPAAPPATEPSQQSMAIEVDHEGNLRPAATPGMMPPVTPNALDMPLPPVMPGSNSGQQQPSQDGTSPQAPPPSPPPFMPQNFM